MRTGYKVLLCSLLLAAIFLAYSFLIPFRSEGPPLLLDSMERLSVDELTEKYAEVGNLILPTWMPDQIQLVEILYIGDAILVYGDEDLEIWEEDDFYRGRVWIEIKPSRAVGLGMMTTLNREVLLVGGHLVTITQNAAPGPKWRKRWMRPVIAEFDHDGFQYTITARKGKTTREELIRIIENVKPVSPQTIRKTAKA